jgi:predicted glycosyltransferase
MPNDSTAFNPKRPRILIYVQDSWGLGHIQRVSRLARALQERADCLILCGHREAGWVIPTEVEYVRLPTLNTPLSKASMGGFWGRPSLLQLSRDDEARIRRKLIFGALDAFEPDVVVVENRPLGMNDELQGLLSANHVRKVLLTRDIITHPTRARISHFSEQQSQALVDLFDKILVAGDQRICDFAMEYNLHPKIVPKIEYVGYISEPISAEDIARVRKERRVTGDAKWIVCSAGGGISGRDLITEFTSLVPSLTNVTADVIYGPHSTLPWHHQHSSIVHEAWGYVHKESRNLALLHAAADLVICPGGYNSTVEIMEGGAPAIAISAQSDTHAEQAMRVSRLQRYYPFTVISDLFQLKMAIENVLRHITRRPIRESGSVDFNGIRNARDQIVSLT